MRGTEYHDQQAGNAVGIAAVLGENILYGKSNDYGLVGLGDLYGPAAALSDILPSAAGVIDALGTNPDALVGAVSGGAVLYRGISPDYSDCIGLALYYPVIATDLGDAETIAANLETYRALGLSGSYADYIEAITLETDKLQVFDGEMVLALDEAGVYSMSVADPADLVSLKSVDVVAKYIQADPDGTETTYLLGAVDAATDWENNYFENTFSMSYKITLDKCYLRTKSKGR